MKISKPLLFVFSLFWCVMGYGQSIQSFIGVRFTDDKQPAFNATSKRKPISLLKVGIRIKPCRLPVFFEPSGSFFLDPIFSPSISDIAEKRVVISYDFGFKHKKSIYGIGYFKSKIENPLSFFIFGFTNNYGASQFYRRNSGPISIELRSQIIFKPIFSGIVPINGNYSIDFLYNFEKESKEVEKQLITHTAFWLSATIGSRFFINKSNSIPLVGEQSPKIGIAPAFGFDILFKNWPISLSCEKDIWIAINGGSTVRDFNGFIANTGFGLKWHQLLKSKKKLRLGINYLITRDLELRELLPHGKEYQIHGIGTSISYEVFPQTEIEFRNNFPFDGRKPFESRLMTLGVFRRLKN